MHYSSILKAQKFIEFYIGDLKKSDRKLKILEVGSKSYHEQDTYRPLFDNNYFEYTGLDIESGNNVDIVPANTFVWKELNDDTFDIIVSGQTFEHNPFFWVTFCEMSRVVKPGGYIFIVAPGSGFVHRYPYDCWRFYPDSWRSLATLTGIELLESYYETGLIASLVSGGTWHDSAMIGRKPILPDSDHTVLQNRIKSLVAPYAELNFDFGSKQNFTGKAFSDYEKTIFHDPNSNNLLMKLKIFIQTMRMHIKS